MDVQPFSPYAPIATTRDNEIAHATKFIFFSRDETDIRLASSSSGFDVIAIRKDVVLRNLVLSVRDEREMILRESHAHLTSRECSSTWSECNFWKKKKKNDYIKFTSS